MMENLDILKLSRIAKELGLKVRKPSSSEKPGLYIAKENGCIEKWNVIEELGINKDLESFAKYLDKNFFESSINSINYNLDEKNDIGERKYSSNDEQLSILSEAS